jgi:dolichol-phosphate mannosyltransferase
MKKTLIIIPTFNEIENIPKLIENIKKLEPDTDILIVDDNSGDGTGDFIRKMENNKMFLISRAHKMGIGSAHKDGIDYAYKNNYDFVITMDADGTHDPKYIHEMKKFNEEYDLINTNRFLNPKSLDDWPISRIIFTKIRFFLNLILLNVSYDSSGAYRCYNLKKINKEHILMSQSNSFFWESMFILKEKKYKIYEIPILLPYRKNGDSKITFLDILNSFLLIWIFFIKRIVGFYK